MTDFPLAIIIPAYKGEYLSITLDSLASQTNKEFNVYIGDDASHDNIYAIVEEYKNRLSINYKRWEHNIGSRSLIKHWQRCIDLTNDEPWLWVLPDDDFIDNDCVEKLLAFINKGSDSVSELLRFNTYTVNDYSQKIGSACINPSHESGANFIADKLMGLRRSSLGEYIFSRNIYKEKGFKEFPMAWCSDDATWLVFSEIKGIVTIPGPFVYIRISDKSISGNIKDYSRLKITACFNYLLWLKENYYNILNKEFIKREKDFDKVTQRWVTIQLTNLKVRFSWLEIFHFLPVISKIWKYSLFSRFKWLFRFRKKIAVS